MRVVSVAFLFMGKIEEEKNKHFLIVKWVFLRCVLSPQFLTRFLYKVFLAIRVSDCLLLSSSGFDGKSVDPSLVVRSQC